uniref:DNA (cytosine-5-)-methyltransferase n=2 Tax=Schizophyllum commune (strain H4-8 / FGSC 9210) TaxID=578458 RepID=D8PU80_SCHCM
MPLELAGGPVRIEAVNPGAGRAPHKAVTIGDAIGDLRRFHWEQQPDHRVNDGIPLLPADGIGRIGYVSPEDAYEHAPRTTFQANARRKPATGDIQHYTAQFNEETAKKVVGIPMEPNADARHLPRAHHTFMLHNPMSANGQAGFNKAYFGRLDEKALFMTITTQMKPTAKQSRCLNPWCRRVITVRELARAQGFPDDFVFKSVKGEHDINTLQRQIGNAVAWPVAAALGRELKDAMLADDTRNREEAELVDSD